MSYYIARLIELPVPESRLVELVINGKSQGIYIEHAKINEGFLRRNNIMPVNLYKGEQYHTERSIDRSTDLFNNPYLWKKLSTFNQRLENDYDDLYSFIDLIRKAEVSDNFFNKLINVADIDEWSKFSAYQTILQSWHNDYLHNMRLLSDMWKGEVIPIAHDTGSDFSDKSNKNIRYDSSPHALFMVYNTSSRFISKKYSHLYKIVSGNTLIKASEHVKALKPLLSASWKRDIFHTQFALTNGHEINDSSVLMMEKKWDILSKNINKRRHIIKKELEEMPNITWNNTNNGFSIVVNGVVPVSQIKFDYNSKEEITEIAFDRDGNGVLSDKDMRIPFTIDGNSILLHAEFYANRILFKNSLDVHGLQRPLTSTVSTQFNLVTNSNISINKVKASNALTLKQSDIVRSGMEGNSPARLNIPVIEEKIKNLLWENKVIIDGTRVIDSPLDVKPGTQIHLTNNSSIIFRNKVNMNGTRKKPIVIKGVDKDTTWGVIALVGKESIGSTISNVTLKQGSGYSDDNHVFSAMLSIHDTSNIKINDPTLEDNKVYDDMMHIVYSKDIEITNCLLNNSFSDAIDIDISSVEIENCKINNSGNDGVDLMSSSVSIKDTTINNSGDKGVSVGEASNVIIFNSSLSKNKIGIEAKDKSISKLIHSELIDNKIQLNAYKKNWRYGAGGMQYIYNSILSPSNNEIKADKKSFIQIYNSDILQRDSNYGKNISISKESSEFMNFIPNKWQDNKIILNNKSGRLDIE